MERRCGFEQHRQEAIGRGRWQLSPRPGRSKDRARARGRATPCRLRLPSRHRRIGWGHGRGDGGSPDIVEVCRRRHHWHPSRIRPERGITFCGHRAGNGYEPSPKSDCRKLGWSDRDRWRGWHFIRNRTGLADAPSHRRAISRWLGQSPLREPHRRPHSADGFGRRPGIRRGQPGGRGSSGK